MIALPASAQRATPTPDPVTARLSQLAAVLVGAAVPMLALGRGFTQVMLVLAAVLALAVGLRTRRPLVDVAAARPLLLCVAAVAAGWLPSVAVSLDPAVSLLAWLRTFAVVGIGVLLWGFLRDDQTRLLQARRALVASAVVLIAGSAAVIVTTAVALQGPDSPLVKGFKPKSSAWMMMAPVLLYVGWGLGRRWLWCALVAVLAAVICLWGTGSRSAAAGVAVGLPLMAAVIALRSHRRAWFLAAGTLVVVVALSIAALKPRPRDYDQTAQMYHLYLPVSLIDAHRQVIWRFTFEKFLERPVLGWGINVINTAPGAHDNIPGMNQEYIPAHPHSWVVEVAAETGVVGFAAFVGVLAWALLALLRRGFTDNSALAAAGTLVCYWVSAAFNFSVWAVWWELCLVAMLVLALAERGAGSASLQDRQ